MLLVDEWKLMADFWRIGQCNELSLNAYIDFIATYI